MRHYLGLFFFFTSLGFSDNLSVANKITQKDLNESCSSKYLEWYLMSENENVWGTAQMKIFFLVDKNFLRRAASSGVDPKQWGKQLGSNFRYFCEQSSTVTVKEAALQTINYMENS